MTKYVVLYARLSVTKEESVSISRQLEAGRLLAQARGWTVVGEYKDDGVSATHNRPEDRVGWRAVLEHPGQVDAVVIWKVDRLARRVIDFLHADEALRERGAGIVAVEDPVDMTTSQGRAFATILAVFGELEAASISARVKAARSALVKAGRVAGGTVPYGWRSIENPDGAGFVLAQDPERIKYVRGMAERVLAGDSIYSVKQWLDQEGAPLPDASQTHRSAEGWAYSTVERLLRNPILAGMTSFQPGRKRHEPKDTTAVLRDESGMPVVDESTAILTTDERRKLLVLLNNRESPQSRPRASKGTTSPLLSGLVTCGHCDRTMHRGTTQGRPALTCPCCHQTITRNQLDPHIIKTVLDERGAWDVYELTDITEDNAAELGDLEQAIQDVSARMTRDDADVPALLDQLTALKEARASARTSRPARRNWRISGRTVQFAWDQAQDDVERREVLATQVGTVRITKGKVGRYLDPNRVEIQWREDPYDEADDMADRAERWSA
jgi:site-specific DNA recombinase